MFIRGCCSWVQFVGAHSCSSFLGVDMYAPLASHDDPTLEEAVAGWAPIVASLSAFSAAHGNKQFVFAEIGYASYAGAATNAPSCCVGPPDPTTQVVRGTGMPVVAPAHAIARTRVCGYVCVCLFVCVCVCVCACVCVRMYVCGSKLQAILYQSFFEAVYSQPFTAGVFWWAWPDGSGWNTGSPCDASFDVWRKPAAAVVSSNYGASAAASAPLPLVVYTNGVTAFANWSWGGVFDLGSAVDPYPGHAACAAGAIGGGGGALALRAPAPLDLSGYTTFEFDVRANASEGYLLQAYLCACDDCASCPVQLPLVGIDNYVTACAVPSEWDAAPAHAHVVIALADLLGAGAGAARVNVSRVQLGTTSGACNFAVDNIVFK